MALPAPVPGLVIRYAFLWREKAARGLEEGSKDRPCAVILVTEEEGGGDERDIVVTVLPITHTPLADADLAIEIPSATKRRLGLDDARSWIVVTDANRFVWPGPDLRFAEPGNPSSYACGLLPRSVYNETRDKFIAAVRARRGKAVTRTE
ncbi:MAG: hypothetical protein WD715_09315 [Dongiaceae bacterium]